jgi:hypothetical protein
MIAVSRKAPAWESIAVLQRRVALQQVLVKAPGARELVRVSLKYRSTPAVPQGGTPSVAPFLTYSFRGLGEYSWANLNGRLIDHCELMANGLNGERS